MATFTGNDSSNTIHGTSSADTINGRGGNDTLRGHGGDDRIFGESGDDRLFGGRGNDIMSGGRGNDHLKAEWGNDTLFGNAGNDILFGDIGNDTLFGGLGNDQLFGGTGIDRMEGGTGNDTYHSSEVGDRLIDTGGIDTLFFYSVREGITLPNNIENLTLRGSFVVGASNDMRGNSLDNVIRNESNANMFFDGRAGNDTLIGGSNWDFFEMSAGSDRVDGRGNGGPGSGDSLQGGSINFRTGVATHTSGTTTFTNIEVGLGGPGSDQLIADDNGRLLLGRDGNDTVRGGAGDDRLYGDGHHEFFEVGIGDDVLTGSGGQDFLQGGAGADRLDGGTGHDRLRGDTAEPGSEGEDVFVFSAAPGSANDDRIHDFQPNLDALAFDSAAFPALGAQGNWGATDDRFHAEDGAVSGHDSDDRLVYDTTAGKLYYDPDGVGGTSGLIVATFDGGPTISASDIVLI